MKTCKHTATLEEFFSENLYLHHLLPGFAQSHRGPTIVPPAYVHSEGPFWTVSRRRLQKGPWSFPGFSQIPVHSPSCALCRREMEAQGHCLPASGWDNTEQTRGRVGEGCQGLSPSQGDPNLTIKDPRPSHGVPAPTRHDSGIHQVTEILGSSSTSPSVPRGLER